MYSMFFSSAIAVLLIFSGCGGGSESSSSISSSNNVSSNQSSNTSSLSQRTVINEKQISKRLSIYRDIYAIDSSGSVWYYGDGIKENRDSVEVFPEIVPGTEYWSGIKLEAINDAVSFIGDYRAGVALHNDGTVWSYGNFIYPQMGQGGIKESGVKKIEGLENIVQMGGTSACIFSLDAYGDVYHMGSCLWAANKGQLYTPTKIETLENITTIASATDSGYPTFIDKNNNVFLYIGISNAWYNNLSSHCDAYCLEPTKVSNLPDNIVDISSNNYVTTLLTENGDVYSIGEKISAGIGSNERHEWMSNVKKLEGLSNIVSISSGDNSGGVMKNGEMQFAVDSDGKLYGWGVMFTEMFDGTVHETGCPRVKSPSLRAESDPGFYYNDGCGLFFSTPREIPSPEALDSIIGVTDKTILIAKSGKVYGSGNLGVEYFFPTDTDYRALIFNEPFIGIPNFNMSLDDEINFSSSSSSSSSSSVSSASSSVSTGSDNYYENFEYKEITSPKTGRIWMDRNLGASKACNIKYEEGLSGKDYYDLQKDCFGHYFQWGRPADGHQLPDHGMTYTQATTITPNHNKVIMPEPGETDDSKRLDWTSADQDGQERIASWDICPNGFHVPTVEEWKAEDIRNTSDGYNKLKLGISLTGGAIDTIKATDEYVGFEQIQFTIIWAGDYAPNNLLYPAGTQSIQEGYATVISRHNTRMAIYNVRCIKDL